MKHAKRVATAAAIVTSGLFAGTAAAAPPQTYDQEIISQYNSANSVETIRHLAVDIGPRRSGTPQELEGALYLKGILDSQLINANDALRTGAYLKTLTFTLSTTNP